MITDPLDGDFYGEMGRFLVRSDGGGPFTRPGPVEGDGPVDLMARGGLLYNSEDFTLSRDGGVSWATFSGSGLDSACTDATWIDGKGSIVNVGEAGCVNRSHDGGVTWTEHGTPLTTERLYSVWARSANEVYAFGADGLFRSRDRGASWSRVSAVFPRSLWGGVWGSGDHELDVVASGGYGDDQPGVFRSMDDGATFTETVPFMPDGSAAELGSLWGAGSERFAVGNHGAIFHSRDGGVTWSEQTSGVLVDLIAAWGSSAGDVYVTGRQGTLLHSTNHGRTWTALDTGQDGDLNGVWGSGPNDVYVVGLHAPITHSSDGGKSWRALGDTVQAFSVTGSGAHDVWVAGYPGLILHSADGEHFDSEPSGDSSSLTAITTLGGDELYAVGDNGTILHRE
jgi:photosystem II stability/assembly factor-like uncharacterized protein